MPHLLIVEDHENLGQSLRDQLRAELAPDGVDIVLCQDLKSARTNLEPCPDLIVLDWMLPDGQGLDFLKELRRKGLYMPVLFLTARAEVIDKVLALELGANDYMTKPFEFRELLARVRVQLRSPLSAPSMSDSNQIRVGELCIDRVKHSVTFRGQTVELVKKEFDLLALFAEQPEKVFSRDEILNRVWGYDVFPTTRTVDTHVLQLRQKIDEALIETVRSVGYRLGTPAKSPGEKHAKI